MPWLELFPSFCRLTVPLVTSRRYTKSNLLPLLCIRIMVELPVASPFKENLRSPPLLEAINWWATTQDPYQFKRSLQWLPIYTFKGYVWGWEEVATQKPSKVSFSTGLQSKFGFEGFNLDSRLHNSIMHCMCVTTDELSFVYAGASTLFHWAINPTLCV